MARRTYRVVAVVMGDRVYRFAPAPSIKQLRQQRKRQAEQAASRREERNAERDFRSLAGGHR